MSILDSRWEVLLTPCPKLSIPSFVRLFVMPRVFGMIGITTGNEHKLQQLIESLTDPTERQVAPQILHPLLKHGIKTYMKDFFIEDKQAAIIESIFKNLILSQYGKEYQRVMSYKTQSNENNNDNKVNSHYQSLLFNTDDVMCLIFSYLIFTDLINCSLVNSYWLYHSFNPNSIYHANVTRLFTNTAKYVEYATRAQAETTARNNSIYSINGSVDNHRNRIDGWISSNMSELIIGMNPTSAILRQWQRFTNIKDIRIFLNYDKNSIMIFENLAKLNKLMLNKLAMFNNIETICARFKDNRSLTIFKVLMQNCAKQIKNYDVSISDINTIRYGQLSALKLIGAKRIVIHDTYFPIEWSNKCQRLIWLGIKHMPAEWCDFIINNCDCTGIEYFDQQASFTVSGAKGQGKGQGKVGVSKIIKQLANKFINLKVCNLDLYGGSNECIWILFESLIPIFKKNNTSVCLTNHIDFGKNDYQRLNNIIYDKQVAIERLIITIEDTWEDSEEYICKLIKNKHLEYIKINLWDGIEPFESIIEMIHNEYVNMNCINSSSSSSYVSSCKMISLEIMDDDSRPSMDCINKFLSLNWDRKDGEQADVCICIMFNDVDCRYEKKKSVSNFRQFCKNISQLMTKGVGISIGIELTNIKTNKIFEKMYNIYLTYFDKKVLATKYERPKCSDKYCTPLKLGQATCKCSNEKDELEIYIKNVAQKEISI